MLIVGMIVVVVHCVVFAIAVMCCVVGFLHRGGKRLIVMGCAYDEVVLMSRCGGVGCVMS